MMKTNATFKNRHSAERGMVMYTVLVTTAILGMSLAGFLTLASNQHRSVARSRAWNLAIPVAEAGIEEALAQIARNTNAGALNSNGWYEDGSAFVKKGQMDNNYYIAKIIPSNPPVIESYGFAEIPYASGSMLERRVRVTVTNTSFFNIAMLADGHIKLSGNDISTDSFDSSDPNYSTDGFYDPLKHKDNGDVATNSGLTNALSAGNANIKGDVSTGYGGSVNIGANGVVGDETWHADGSTGIQPGKLFDDMNVDLPLRDAPFTTAVPPMSYTIGGTNYTYVMDSRDFALPSLSLSGDEVVLIQGDVELYVAGDIAVSGEAKIIIDPGATLTIYAAGSKTQLSGAGIVNADGTAASFSYVGLETNTKIQLSGNADFIGTIYAPKADLSLGGGGSSITDFIGSVAAGTISMNGIFNFHYDEQLARIPTPGHYTVTSWNEF